MQFPRQRTRWACLAATLTLSVGMIRAKEKATDYQYRFASIDIPVATAHEPTRSSLSVKRALDYIEGGALAWSKPLLSKLAEIRSSTP